MKMKKNHTQKNTLLKAAEGNAATKAFKRVFFSPSQEEFQNIFSCPSKKIKTPDTQAMIMQTADTYRHDNWTTEKEAHAHNKGLPKAGVTNFYDTFVLNRTLVFQINSSAETPRLRQAPNRYRQP
ncbi:MAG TPA: hypothetical protein VFM99_01305 [Chitinophagales bacterium]|nr:hypothetical protein [Chitinophagales bacterium]